MIRFDGRTLARLLELSIQMTREQKKAVSQAAVVRHLINEKFERVK